MGGRTSFDVIALQQFTTTGLTPCQEATTKRKRMAKKRPKLQPSQKFVASLDYYCGKTKQKISQIPER